MEAIITDIVRGCYHDGPGLRTVVTFKGCPLHCAWCHSPHTWAFMPNLWYESKTCIGCNQCISQCISNAIEKQKNNKIWINFEACKQCMRCTKVCPTKSLRKVGDKWQVENLAENLKKDRILFRNTGGGVTLSGGECLAQSEACYRLLQNIHNEGIHTAIETCGYAPRKVLESILPFTDLFLYDIKLLDPGQHEKWTGVSNEQIIQNLYYLADMQAKIQVRSPLIPQLNDSEEFKNQLRQMCNDLGIAPPEFLPLNPATAEIYGKIGIPFRCFLLEDEKI